MRRHERQAADDEPAESRLKHGRETAALEHVFDEGDGAHDADANGRAEHGQDEERQEVVLGESGRRNEPAHETFFEAEAARDEHTADGSGHDRCQAEGRVSTDDEFEGVESPGEGRSEGRADRARRTAADKGAHIAAAQFEGRADARSEAGADLRVSRFRSKRGAGTVRHDRLAYDEQAVDERHAAALQRVGFDRIDGTARSPLLDQKAGDPEHETACNRHQGFERRRERAEVAQMGVQGHAVQDMVQEAYAADDCGDRDAGQAAGNNGQQYKRIFAPPDEGPKMHRKAEPAGSRYMHARNRNHWIFSLLSRSAKLAKRMSPCSNRFSPRALPKMPRSAL